jgi:ATP-dependent RNA helicase DeaD
MNKFKNSEFEFLVATDVAARGIDVDDLEVVINYDLPHDPEDYVHRIGRTGRAGRKGMAATFVSGRDIYKIQYLEKFTHSRIRRGVIPTPSEVEGKRSELLFGKVRDMLAAGKFSDQTQFTDRLMEEGFQATELCSALFSMLLGQTGSPEPVNPPKAVPLPVEIPMDEGFAQPKGFKKKPPFVPKSPAQGKPAFKPAFKPGFKKNFDQANPGGAGASGKPGKFSKGFKKDRPPRY